MITQKIVVEIACHWCPATISVGSTAPRWNQCEARSNADAMGEARKAGWTFSQPTPNTIHPLCWKCSRWREAIGDH